MAKTPLHVAAGHNSFEVVKFLLNLTEAETVELEAKNMYGETPLHMAAKNGSNEVVGLLLSHGASTEAKANEWNEANEDGSLLETLYKALDEVWRINGSAKTPVPKKDIGKFYSGDCCIVLYTYDYNGKKKEDYYLCWVGKDSIEEKLEEWLLKAK